MGLGEVHVLAGERGPHQTVTSLGGVEEDARIPDPRHGLGRPRERAPQVRIDTVPLRSLL